MSSREDLITRAEVENLVGKLNAEIAELKLSRTQKAMRAIRRNKRAVLIATAVTMVIPIALYAVSITKSFNFIAGNPTVASEVNANFDQLFTKVNDLAAYHPPVGTILAWHKSLTGTPSLPASGEWVECNGQTISDIQSPYNTQAIPDLNSSPANPAGGNYAGGYFLRGGTTSGMMQDDRFQGHLHTINPIPGVFDSVATGGSNAWSSSTSRNTSGPITDGTNGTPRTANETRPVNMSVVWIMKVK